MFIIIRFFYVLYVTGPGVCLHAMGEHTTEASSRQQTHSRPTERHAGRRGTRSSYTDNRLVEGLPNPFPYIVIPLLTYHIFFYICKGWSGAGRGGIGSPYIDNRSDTCLPNPFLLREICYRLCSHFVCRNCRVDLLSLYIYIRHQTYFFPFSPPF